MGKPVKNSYEITVTHSEKQKVIVWGHRDKACPVTDNISMSGFTELDVEARFNKNVPVCPMCNYALVQILEITKK